MDKYYRSLLRVDKLVDDQSFDAILPAYIHEATLDEPVFRIKYDDIPKELHKYIKPKARFFIHVNLGNQNLDEIKIINFTYKD